MRIPEKENAALWLLNNRKKFSEKEMIRHCRLKGPTECSAQ